MDKQKKFTVNGIYYDIYLYDKNELIRIAINYQNENNKSPKVIMLNPFLVDIISCDLARPRIYYDFNGKINCLHLRRDMSKNGNEYEILPIE